nr:hypothetical protein [Candidatus Sigynarchaeota archaeon]
MENNVKDSQPSKIEGPVPLSELWDQIGFHKPMAGFWTNLVFTLIGIVLSAVLMGALISYFYPFPESLGMKDIAFGYFSLFFGLMDIGTGAVMGRFIPEVNIKNPEKMLHLIQYFIHYQMITGLIQTTLVSIYALFIAPSTSMGYTVWIMLVASTIQYPGMLGAFRGVLGSLQQFNKTVVLDFIMGTIFQNTTNFLFVYLGRVIGEQVPTYGPVLGIAIGAAIGSYIDDFFAMWLSAWYFKKALKPYGITPLSCFKREFTWDEIKPVVWYSLKTGLPGFITGPLNYMSFLITITYIPHYTTLTFLAIVGGSIGDVFTWFGRPDISPLISESYMNNKPRLTQYYIGQDTRFNAIILGFFFPLILLLDRVMPDAWVALGMAQYVYAGVYIVPRLIRASIERFFGLPGSIMYGANRPNFSIILGIVHTILDLIVKWILYVVLAIPGQLELVQLIYFLEWAHLPLALIMNAIAYIYVDKKIVKIKIPWAQILLGFALPAAIVYCVLIGIKFFIYDPIYAQAGFFAAALPGIACIALTLLLLYFPLSAALGGWDDTNLDEFRKAARMSGASRLLVWPMYLVLARVCKVSKLHGRFGMPIKEVIQDAQDLLVIKRANRERLREKLAKA